MLISCNIRNVIRPGNRYFAKLLKIGVLIAVTLSMFAGKANALIVPSENTTGGLYLIDNDVANRLGEGKFGFVLQQQFYLGGCMNLSGYNSIIYHYPWWLDGYFKEGDNIEWIYKSLENQYSFLDNALYKLSGSNYLLGPVWAPCWHGFDDFYWAADIKHIPGIQKKKLLTRTIVSDKLNTVKFTQFTSSGRQIQRLGNLSNTYIDDIVSGDISNQFQIQNINSVLVNDGGMTTQDIAAIPEPSGILLFGLMGLKILACRRRTA